MLAGHLGGMTVGEMLQRMSSAEYAGWMAYCRIEPLGEYRADLRSGVVASTVFNMNRGKNVAARSPGDFMPVQQDKQRKTEANSPDLLEKQLIKHFSEHNRKRKK